jgi:hypothetical protein
LPAGFGVTEVTPTFYSSQKCTFPPRRHVHRGPALVSISFRPRLRGGASLISNRFEQPLWGICNQATAWPYSRSRAATTFTIDAPWPRSGDTITEMMLYAFDLLPAA